MTTRLSLGLNSCKKVQGSSKKACGRSRRMPRKHKVPRCGRETPSRPWRSGKPPQSGRLARCKDINVPRINRNARSSAHRIKSWRSIFQHHRHFPLRRRRLPTRRTRCNTQSLPSAVAQDSFSALAGIGGPSGAKTRRRAFLSHGKLARAFYCNESKKPSFHSLRHSRK